MIEPLASRIIQSLQVECIYIGNTMEVVIRAFGRAIRVRLSADSSVSTLKSCLETLTGVPTLLQHLRTGTRHLSDADRINLIDGDAFLEVDSSSPFPLRFVVHLASRDLFPLVSKMTDTGLLIKARIAQETGMDVSGRTLMLGDRQLEDDRTVAEVWAPGIFDLTICEKSIQHSTVSARDITIMTHPDICERVSIRPSESVNSFLARWKGTKSWLVYRDRALEPSERLDAIHECVTWGDLLLHVRTGGIGSFDFAATSTLSVSVLTRALEKRLAATDISLVYRGLLLEGSCSLDECGCDGEETIEVVLHRYFWVESDTERVCIRDPELEVEATAVLQKYRAQTGDQRDFQWMLLDGQLLQPGQRYSIRSGAVVELSKQGYLLPIATGAGMLHTVISGISSVQFVQRKLSRYYGPGQLFAKSSELPTALRLFEAKHLPLCFARTGEQIFTFRFSDGCSLFLPFSPSTAASKVIARLQTALETSDSLQLVNGNTPVTGSISVAKNEDFLYVCRGTEVVISREGKAAFRYVTLPTFKMEVFALKTYCDQEISPLFFTSRFLNDHDLLSDCNVEVGTCIRVLDSSAFASDHTVPSGRIPNKFLILKRIDSTQHLIRLHEDDSWDSFAECVHTVLGEPFILLSNQHIFTASHLSAAQSGQVLHVFKSSDDVVVVLSMNERVEWAHVSRTFTLQQVKAAARVSSDRSLVFRDAVLEDRRTWESYGLTAVDVLMAVHPTEHIVTIRRPGAEPLFLATKEEHLIDNIQKQQGLYATGSSRPKLYINTYSTGEKFRVNSQSEFWLVDANYIRIIGETAEGASAYVFVRKTGTIGDLRTAFAEKLLIHRSFIRLLFSYCALENDCSTLNETGITEDCKVRVLKPSEILVTVTNDQVRLQFAEVFSASIVQLTETVAKALSAEMKNVHLIYRDQLLSDSTTLEVLTSTNDLTLRLLLLKSNEKLLVFHSLLGRSTFTVFPTDQVTFASVLSAAAQVTTTPQLYWTEDLINDTAVGDYCLQADSELCLLSNVARTESIVLPLFTLLEE